MYAIRSYYAKKTAPKAKKPATVAKKPAAADKKPAAEKKARPTETKARPATKKSAAAQQPDATAQKPAGAKKTAPRITSYNVCYTKLLRGKCHCKRKCAQQNNGFKHIYFCKKR